MTWLKLRGFILIVRLLMRGRWSQARLRLFPPYRYSKRRYKVGKDRLRADKDIVTAIKARRPSGWIPLDDALLFRSHRITSPVSAVIWAPEGEVWPDAKDPLKNPTYGHLDQLIHKGRYDREVAGYLDDLAKTPDAQQDVYWFKVGVRRITDGGVPDGPLTLEVYPLSYWFDRYFNRRAISMLVWADGEPIAVDSRLRRIVRRLRKSTIEAILSDGNNAHLRYPSVLFVEACVITSDSSIVTWMKPAGVGDYGYARIERGWTSTLEHGVRWEDLDIERGEVKIPLDPAHLFAGPPVIEVSWSNYD